MNSSNTEHLLVLWLGITLGFAATRLWYSNDIDRGKSAAAIVHQYESIMSEEQIAGVKEALKDKAFDYEGCAEHLPAERCK